MIIYNMSTCDSGIRFRGKKSYFQSLRQCDAALLIMQIHTYSIFSHALGVIRFQLNLLEGIFTSSATKKIPITMQLVMVLFFVPWEGSLMITSSLLTFAGTDCNVSGSFPMSKHISERHRGK